MRNRETIGLVKGDAALLIARKLIISILPDGPRIGYSVQRIFRQYRESRRMRRGQIVLQVNWCLFIQGIRVFVASEQAIIFPGHKGRSLYKTKGRSLYQVFSKSM